MHVFIDIICFAFTYVHICVQRPVSIPEPPSPVWPDFDKLWPGWKCWEMSDNYWTAMPSPENRKNSLCQTSRARIAGEELKLREPKPQFKFWFALSDSHNVVHWFTPCVSRQAEILSNANFHFPPQYNLPLESGERTGAQRHPNTLIPEKGYWPLI